MLHAPDIGLRPRRFWDILWFIFISFALVAYLMVMFSIVGDLFRDRTTSGGVKAVWIVLLAFLPFLTSIAYLVMRGGGMAERNAAAVTAVREAQRNYVSGPAASSPSEEIAKAKGLVVAGTITDEEFTSLKAKALA